MIPSTGKANIQRQKKEQWLPKAPGGEPLTGGAQWIFRTVTLFFMIL